MKLFVIAADINPGDFGGAEYHLIEVLKRISPRFEKVTLFLGSSSKIKELFPKPTNIEFVTITYPRITNFVGILYIIFALPKIVRYYFHDKPEIVWAKQEFPQGVIGAILKKFGKFKLIVTSQSARLYKDELVAVGLPKIIAGVFSYLAKLLVSVSFKNADVVSAVSSFSAGESKSLGATKTVIIPNGIDLEKFKPTNSLRKNPFVIVSTSSLIPRNGLDVLINACNNLPKTFNWRLEIAGIGPEADNLRKMASDKVSLLGYVENSKIPKLLRDANLFVRVSRAEGFGSSFLEAMAVGLPVIATPVGGIVDFVKDGKTGFLVEPEDRIGLTDKILYIFKNPKKVREVCQAAEILVRKNYNWDTIARKFESGVLELDHD